MHACHGNKYNFCWCICSGLASPGWVPTTVVPLTAFACTSLPQASLCVCGACYQQPNSSTWSFSEQESKNYGACKPHRASSRPSSWQKVSTVTYWERNQCEGLIWSVAGVWKSAWPLWKQNRVLWHQEKTRRWTEHNHLKELLKINIPEGKTHLEDLIAPLSISNKDHVPAQGKLQTCNLQVQLVSKCLHKKHNNNCSREGCSNLHQTLSSR